MLPWAAVFSSRKLSPLRLVTVCFVIVRLRAEHTASTTHVPATARDSNLEQRLLAFSSSSRHCCSGMAPTQTVDGRAVFSPPADECTCIDHKPGLSRGTVCPAAAARPLTAATTIQHASQEIFITASLLSDELSGCEVCGLRHCVHQRSLPH